MANSNSKPFSKLTAYLHNKRKWVIFAIILIAVVFRLIYFLQISSGPCLLVNDWQESDMYFFNSWAKQIVGGDVLTDKSLHPFHKWHKDIAAKYFNSGHGQGDYSDAAAHSLWNSWYGEKRFHQEPLYPYLIAVTYFILSQDQRWVFAWQMLLGIASICLIYLITSFIFDELTGVTASLFALFAGNMLFYEVLLLRTSLIIFIGLLMVYLLLIMKENWRWYSGLGFLFGLALMLKTTFLLFILLVLGSMVFQKIRKPEIKIYKIPVLLGGMLIALSPFMVRNIIVGVSPLSFSSVNAVTFINSNAEDYPPEQGFFISSYTEEIMAKTNGDIIPVCYYTLKTHSLTSYLQQLCRKFNSVWHWYEKPNNCNFYYFGLYAWILKLPATFLIIGSWGIIGLFMAVKKFIKCQYLYFLLASLLMTFMLSYILSRFRLPFTVLLIPFAGYAVIQTIDFIYLKNLKALGAVCLSLIILSFWISRPLPSNVPEIRPFDYSLGYKHYYFPKAEKARAQQNWQETANIFFESLQYEPLIINSFCNGKFPETPFDEQFLVLYSRVHFYYAEALANSGHKQEAILQKQRALKLQNILLGNSKTGEK